MAQLDFIVRVNDTDSDIRSTLRDVDGNPVNLTGATVRFRMRPAAGPASPLTVDQPAVIDNAAGGEVHYAWVAADTDTPGLYLAEWRVTFGDGTIESFPNGAVLYVLVSEGLSGSDRVYTSLAELKSLLRIKGNEHDAALMTAVSSASRAIDASTGRRFWPDANANQVRKYRTVSPNYVRIDDLITLTSLSDSAGAWTLDTDFVLEPLNAAADGRPWDTIRALAIGGSGWVDGELVAGRPFTRGRLVTLTGRFGWLEPPAQIRTASAILAGQLFLRPQQAVFGVVGLGFEGEGQRIPFADPHVEGLVRPFRRSSRIE